jgi:hypothetical protein
MSIAHLFDNQPATWQADSWANGYEDGNTFYAPTGGGVTKLGWYRRTTGADDKPSALRLWDRVTQQAVETVSPVPDDGAVGWQWETLDVPVVLVGNRKYTVTHASGPNSWVSSQSYSNRVAPPQGLNWADPGHALSDHNGQGTFPSFENTNLIRPVDVEWDSTKGDTPAAISYPDLLNALASWLDPEDATRPDTNVKLIPRSLAKIDIPTEEEWAVLEKLWKVAGVMTDAELALARELWKWGQSWFGGNTTTGASAVKSAAGVTVLQKALDIESKLNTMDAKLTTILSTLNGVAHGIGDYPFGWGQSDSTDFDAQLAWNEPADMYVLDIDAWPPGTGAVDIAGVRWLPRIGWWSTLNDPDAGIRGFVEFQHQQLHLNGSRMPGVIINCKPGTTGTVQAWYRQ